MKKKILELSAVYLCVLACAFGLNLFNQYVLMLLPLYGRMLCMLLTVWSIALVPLVITLRRKTKPEELGFSSRNIPAQIFTGVVFALAMSVVLTLVPHLAGYGELVDSGARYQHLWQYLYEFFYCIAAVGAAEEFVFRGYFYAKFRGLFSGERAAVLGSSILFGLLHIFSGNIAQVFMTMLFGALLCIARLKVKNCTLLSLIIAHGVYDALISVWSSLLPK